MSSNKTKQHISAQYCVKQMSENWCKNIQAFLRYSNFCAEIFYFASPCKYALDPTGRRRPQTPSCADPSLFQRLRRSCSESGLMQRACPMYNDLYWRSIWDIVHGLFNELTIGPLSSKMAENRHLGNRHGVIFLPWAVRFG